MALRLRKVIGSVVAEDQTCSVPGRFIGEGVRLVLDLIDNANSTGRPLAILALDQEKAFDRVDWDFLERVLVRFGFGPSFCRWVHLFYTGPISTVLVNGYFTEPFGLSRGVRQGCPLSAPLYVLVAETLASYFRASEALPGYRLPAVNSGQALVASYADDTTVFCASNEEILTVFQLLRKYTQATGAAINMAKTKGLWCGPWKGRTDKPVDIAWSSEHITCLGIVVGHGCLERENWDHRIAKLERVIKSWRQRSLSYTGKALVLNALALSGLWYVASLIPAPDWVVKSVNALVYPFFWGGKRDLVARKIIALPKRMGGYGVVDFRQKALALKSVWIKRLTLNPTAKWVQLLRHEVASSLGVSVEELVAFPAFYPCNLLPTFYAEMFNGWALVKGFTSRAGPCFVSWEGKEVALVEGGTKSLYQALTMCPLPVPHCTIKFRPFFGELYWRETWSQLHLMPIDRKVIDTNWKIAHGVIYTANFLRKFNLEVEAECFCGHQEENPPHLFFSCQFMVSLLAWAQTIFYRASPLSPAIVLRHMLFGFNRQELETVPPVFVYFLLVIKYCVWIARNGFRFEGVRPEVETVKKHVVAHLNTHLGCFAKRFGTPRKRRLFHRAWNVLGKFSPDIRTISFE